MLAAGLSETDANIETNRYIRWPGQALTYKVGQREIERLRARDRPSRRLAVRPARVPRRVIGHGSLPLATLARELPNWVATPGLILPLAQRAPAINAPRCADGISR